MLIIYKSINQSIIHSVIQPFIHSIAQPFLRSVVLFLFLSMTILLFGCKQTTEPKLEAELKLELEDVSCTEAWIKLTTTNLQLPATINLLQDGNLSETISLLSANTLLYVDSLLPNQTYKFQATIQLYLPKAGIQAFNHSGLPAEGRHSSNELTVTTMDTTSHNFTWQSWEFGQHSSSTLYDVAIIDENNIWAVGEIYMNDSLGNPDPSLYNLIKWDGISWKPERVYFKNSQGQSFLAPMKSIFAFNANDVWIGLDQIIYWNGSTYKSIELPDAVFQSWINKIWGSSSEDLYAVGNNGNIAHWDGVRWRKIESGTTLNINDIWGDYNEKTGQWEILAVASNYGNNLEMEILFFEKNKIQKLSTESNPQMEPLLTNWFVPNRQYYVAGAGIYQKHLLKDSKWKHNLFNITTFATTSIRGNDINDVIGVGAFGDFVHFNGVSWKNDYEEPLLSNGSYTKVAIKGDLVVAVGGNQISINSVAVILFGRR